VAANATLTANGALVLGQDQDSLNGGFSSTQAFLGQLDEVAVYQKALTQARVQAHRTVGVNGGGCTALTALSASDTPSVQAAGTQFLRTRAR
jgi:hypothetical protein